MINGLSVLEYNIAALVVWRDMRVRRWLSEGCFVPLNKENVKHKQTADIMGREIMVIEAGSLQV